MATFDWATLEDDVKSEITIAYTGLVQGFFGDLDNFAVALAKVMTAALAAKDDAAMLTCTKNIQALALANKVKLVNEDAVRAQAGTLMADGVTEKPMDQLMAERDAFVAEAWLEVGRKVMTVGRIALKVVLAAK